MRRAGARRWAVLAVGLALLPGACAPRLQPPAAMLSVPALLDDRLVMEDGAALPLRRWLPDDAGAAAPRAVVLALHGFNDYSNAFDNPAAAWAAQGIATYAYDQRGFGATPHRGLWPGDERLIEDLRAAAALVAARHPGRPLYLLGDSMGAAVVMAAATSAAPPAADGLILVAPAAWGRATQGPLYSAVLWAAAHTVPWLTVTGEGLGVTPSDNVEMLRALGRDPLVIKETRVDAIYGLVGLMDKGYDAAPLLTGPALVLYGAHEEVIPEDAALALLRRLPPAGTQTARAPRLAVYRDGYHMLLRDLQAATVHRDVAAWIADPAAALPSGADGLAVVALARDSLSEAAEAARTAPPAAAAAP